MDKTLTIHLADQRKDLASAMTYMIYKGELTSEHVGSCAYNDTPENHCNCALNDLIELVRGGQ
jgi:hypothetical protein